MKIARSALSVTVLDNRLYAMGGYDGANFVASVEVYDPLTNRWEDGEPLTSGRSGHASAVCYSLCPNNFHVASSSSSSKHDTSLRNIKHSKH